MPDPLPGIHSSFEKLDGMAESLKKSGIDIMKEADVEPNGRRIGF